MPIRLENKARYPADWAAISLRIRERAGQRCEECGVANYALGGRHEDGRFLPALPLGEKLLRVEWPQPGMWAWCDNGGAPEYRRIVRIVLTVAHLDHQPENCGEENLRAWCQRCHNRYDSATRRRGTQERERVKRAVGDLPL